jgi:hypothetical protein
MAWIDLADADPPESPARHSVLAQGSSRHRDLPMSAWVVSSRSMIESPMARRPERRSTVALMLACLSLALSLIACGVAGFSMSDDRDSSSDRALSLQSEPVVASASQVEAVAHVTLPPGSVLLSAAYSNGLETRLSVKFRMPRTALDAFLRSAKFTAPVTPGLRAVDAKGNVGGGNLWDPETAKNFSGIEEQDPTPDGTRRAVLINLDASDAVTVYLYAGRN